MSIFRLNPEPRWSDATVFNGIAHFVEVADPKTAKDFTSQVADVFLKAEQTLAQINSDKSRLLSVTVYLPDMSNLAEFNQLWEAWLPQGSAPSRACIKAELVDPALLVEIAFVAAAKASNSWLFD